MGNRKLKITLFALTLFNVTAWGYMIVTALAGWSLSDNFFATYMTGNAFISGAFVGGNMFEHKQKKE